MIASQHLRSKVHIWLIYKGTPLYKCKKISYFRRFRILSDLNRWVLNIFSICKKQSREFFIYLQDFQSFGDSYATPILQSKLREICRGFWVIWDTFFLNRIYVPHRFAWLWHKKRPYPESVLGQFLHIFWPRFKAIRSSYQGAFPKILGPRIINRIYITVLVFASPRMLSFETQRPGT